MLPEVLSHGPVDVVVTRTTPACQTQLTLVMQVLASSWVCVQHATLPWRPHGQAQQSAGLAATSWVRVYGALVSHAAHQLSAYARVDGTTVLLASETGNRADRSSRFTSHLRTLLMGYKRA